MKKTICIVGTLLACAIAQAASLPTNIHMYTLGNTTDVYFHTTNNPTEITSSSGVTLDWTTTGEGSVSKQLPNFLLTFSLTVAENETMSADKSIISTHTSGIHVKLAEDGSQLYITQGNNVSTKIARSDSATYTFAYVDGYARLFDTAVTDAATLSSTSNDDWLYVGTNHALKQWNGSGVSKGYAGDGVTLNIGNVTAVNVAAVPEPATATLSLLALAGLAARRRRK